jgi:leukotriene-A4 hydrolase
VPYEKGYTFLRYLEALIGKEDFQKLLVLYINKYTYKSVTWIDFKLTFTDFVSETYSDKAEEILSKIDWEGWVKTTGEPLIKPEFCKYIISNIFRQ